jgi:hypothetical protein
MSTIWSFGCSFSSGYLDVPQTDSYPNLLGKEMGYDVINNSKPGSCNDKIFYELTSNIEKIKSGDIIVYQFSSFNRIGFFETNNVDTYFSSAGIPELGVQHKSKENQFKEYTIGELTSLLDFILKWQPKRRNFLLGNPLKILNYLKKEKKITIIILFLTNEMLYYNDTVIPLPTHDNPKNLSLNDYLYENGLTIGHENPEKYPLDTHPGFNGHKKIMELIKEKLKIENLI